MNKEAKEWKEIALQFKEMLEKEMRSHQRTRAKETEVYNQLLELQIEELNRISNGEKHE